MIGKGNAYRVVQLGYPPVRDGQTGEQDKINKGMDVALLGEVEVQRTATAAPSGLEVFHDVLEQGQRSEDTDFLPVKGMRSEKIMDQPLTKYFSAGSIPYSWGATRSKSALARAYNSWSLRSFP